MIYRQLTSRKFDRAILALEIISPENILSTEFNFMACSMTIKKTESFGQVKDLCCGSYFGFSVLGNDLGPTGKEEYHGLLPGDYPHGEIGIV